MTPTESKHRLQQLGLDRDSESPPTPTPTHLCQRRTLDVFDGAQFAGQFLAVLERDGPLLVLGQLLVGGRVVSQVDLGADQQERRLLTVVSDLRHPLPEGRSHRGVTGESPVL